MTTINTTRAYSSLVNTAPADASNYLLTLVDPFSFTGNYAQIPDGNDTPWIVPKQVMYSADHKPQVSYFMIIHRSHAVNPFELWGALNETSPFRFIKFIAADENLADNYTLARKVSGGVKIMLASFSMTTTSFGGTVSRSFLSEAEFLRKFTPTTIQSYLSSAAEGGLNFYSKAPATENSITRYVPLPPDLIFRDTNITNLTTFRDNQKYANAKMIVAGMPIVASNTSIMEVLQVGSNDTPSAGATVVSLIPNNYVGPISGFLAGSIDITAGTYNADCRLCAQVVSITNTEAGVLANTYTEIGCTGAIADSTAVGVKRVQFVLPFSTTQILRVDQLRFRYNNSVLDNIINVEANLQLHFPAADGSENRDFGVVLFSQVDVAAAPIFAIQGIENYEAVASSDLQRQLPNSSPFHPYDPAEMKAAQQVIRYGLHEGAPPVGPLTQIGNFPSNETMKVGTSSVFRDMGRGLGKGAKWLWKNRGVVEEGIDYGSTLARTYTASTPYSVTPQPQFTYPSNTANSKHGFMKMFTSSVAHADDWEPQHDTHVWQADVLYNLEPETWDDPIVLPPSPVHSHHLTCEPGDWEPECVRSHCTSPETVFHMECDEDCTCDYCEMEASLRRLDREAPPMHRSTYSDPHNRPVFEVLSLEETAEVIMSLKNDKDKQYVYTSPMDFVDDAFGDADPNIIELPVDLSEAPFVDETRPDDSDPFRRVVAYPVSNFNSDPGTAKRFDLISGRTPEVDAKMPIYIFRMDDDGQFTNYTEDVLTYDVIQDFAVAQSAGVVRVDGKNQAHRLAVVASTKPIEFLMAGNKQLYRVEYETKRTADGKIIGVDHRIGPENRAVIPTLTTHFDFVTLVHDFLAFEMDGTTGNSLSFAIAMALTGLTTNDIIEVGVSPDGYLTPVGQLPTKFRDLAMNQSKRLVTYSAMSQQNTWSAQAARVVGDAVVDRAALMVSSPHKKIIDVERLVAGLPFNQQIAEVFTVLSLVARNGKAPAPAADVAIDPVRATEQIARFVNQAEANNNKTVGPSLDLGSKLVLGLYNAFLGEDDNTFPWFENTKEFGDWASTMRKEKAQRVYRRNAEKPLALPIQTEQSRDALDKLVNKIPKDLSEAAKKNAADTLISVIKEVLKNPQMSPDQAKVIAVKIAPWFVPEVKKTMKVEVKKKAAKGPSLMSKVRGSRLEQFDGF